MNVVPIQQQQQQGYSRSVQQTESVCGDERQTTAAVAAAATNQSVDSMAATHFPKLSDIRPAPASTSETIIIYRFLTGNEEIPTRIRLPIHSDKITLRDFKQAVSLPNKQHCKFYCKSHDKDVGIVKEEIIDDNQRLPLYQGKVWVYIQLNGTENVNLHTQRSTDISSSHRLGRSTEYGDQAMNWPGTMSEYDSTTTETESMISSRPGGQYISPKHRGYNCKSNHGRSGKYSDSRYHRGWHRQQPYDSSVVTSDMESYVDSDDDDYDDQYNSIDSDDDYDDDYSSRISSTTEETSVSRLYISRRHRMRNRRRNRDISGNSSVNSFSDMFFRVIRVILSLEEVNYLGISLVGCENQSGGDGGIFVNGIMQGGAVHLDGRIASGDMILQVNDVNFSHMTNDEAVQVIRDAVKKPGPIKLLVAKCSERNPKGQFTIPRSEPVRPIDPGAWVAHTEAARAKFTNPENFPFNHTALSYNGAPSIADSEAQIFSQQSMPPISPFSTSSDSFGLSNPTTLLPGSPLRNSMRVVPSVPNPTVTSPGQLSLNSESNLESIACAMASPHTGIEVRERVWLKIRIPNAILGSDVINWLQEKVKGLKNRKEAKKIAIKLIEEGFIQHTVNSKKKFSAKCYYMFADFVTSKARAKSNSNSEFNSNSPQQAAAAAAAALNAKTFAGLEERFSNGIRLTNENFQPMRSAVEPDSVSGTFGSLPNQPMSNVVQGELPANATNVPHGMNANKPGMYMMPFMRYWDDNCEIHNYGFFGPQPEISSETITSNNSGNGGINCRQESYQSDESQRSAPSVVYNPQAITSSSLPQTNTMASSGSNGSRHTNKSNPPLTLASHSSSNESNHNNNNNASSNLLNHHYEDLQMNPATGNLVPTSAPDHHHTDQYHSHHHHPQQQQQQQMYGHNGNNSHCLPLPTTAATTMLHHQHRQPEPHDSMSNGDSGNNGDIPLNIEHIESVGGGGGVGALQQQPNSKMKGFHIGALNKQSSFNGPNNNTTNSNNSVRNSFRKAMNKP